MSGEKKNEPPFTTPRAAEAKKAEQLPKTPQFAHDISEKGLEFIAAFEGTRSQFGPFLYNDPLGYATVGYGHLIGRRGVTLVDRIRYRGFTKTKAIALLHQDAARYVAAVNALGLHLTQNELDALVSFAFNLGPGALQGGILARLRAGDKPGAMAVLREYVHGGGQVMPGLVRRREAESNLFLHGTY